MEIRALRKLATLCLLLVSATSLGATTYYLDATNGQDQATGTAPAQAWKSLSKIRSLDLKPGDRILLKKGEVFHGELHLHGRGTAGNPIVVDQYGAAAASPCIKGTEQSLFAVYVFNCEYIEIRNLEIVNTGTERLPHRTGIKVHLKDYGVARSTLLKGLYIHDVNGSLVKAAGGGSGILIVNEGDRIRSAFDGLLIEDCTIRRCERNGMIWKGYSSRRNWFPSRRVVVRRNLIDQVPGDGIVPIGCVGTRIEYNKMQDCPPTLPITEAAAGIWPWSCDSTLIQYNEVSDHRAPWDAQGFDSDDNCRYTTFQYNYSHDNEGGFMLICHDGSDDRSENIGTIGTVVRYNISINDAVRHRYTRAGYFSPSIHISGPVTDTRIERNIVHIGPKPGPTVDRRVVVSDHYGGYADQTAFRENIFYTAERSAFDLSHSTGNSFMGNRYLGPFGDLPPDPAADTDLAPYLRSVENDPWGYHFLSSLMDTCRVGNGTAELRFVNPTAIETLFNTLR